MYLRILLVSFKCSLPGSAINRLTNPTTCAIFGLVQIMAYIRLPTTNAYNIRDIFILSASLVGHTPEDNLQFTGSGVETGLQSCMLKHYKIFLK